MIATEVNLHNYGLPGGTIQGAPVEGAFSPDKQYFYVSNYSMFGPGPGPEEKTPARRLLPARRPTRPTTSTASTRPPSPLIK